MKLPRRPFAIFFILLLPLFITGCADTVVTNPDHINLIDGGNQNWYPAPGYNWVHVDKNGKPYDSDLAVIWTPGMSYDLRGVRLYPNTLAANEEGYWYPAPGYKWAHTDAGGNPIPGDYSVEWEAGREYRKSNVLVYPHILSAYTEGQWYPAPGYRWNTLDAQGQPVGMQVTWTPAAAYSYLNTATFPHIHASQTQDNWYPDSGYAWTHLDASGNPIPGDFSVYWHPHYAYMYDERVFWPHVEAAEIEGSWCPLPGYTWAHPDDKGQPPPFDYTVRWLPGASYFSLGKLTQPNIIATQKEDSWTPAPGYAWTNPDDKNDFTVILKTDNAPQTNDPARAAPAPVPTPTPTATPTPEAPPPPDDQPRQLK